MLSIGEFSKLCMVTTKTLRHYDIIGLLKPLKLNEDNGYRYYGVKQFNTMFKIIRLKDYGFSLDEIMSLLEVDDDCLSNAMRVKHNEMKVHLEQTERNLMRLERDIEDLKKGVFMKQQLEISIVETLPVNIASIRETIAIKDFSKLMEKLYALSLPCEGPLYAIYHCPCFNPDATDVEVGFQTNVKSNMTRTLEGGICVKAMHYGDYSNLPESYLSLAKWIEENGYSLASAPYERYINDPADTPKDKLITEIYFPIKK